MDDEKDLKNEELENSIEIDEEPAKEDEIVDVELNIDYDIEKVDELNEYESMVLASKVEVEIQMYEDILLKGEKEFLSFEEFDPLGFKFSFIIIGFFFSIIFGCSKLFSLL